MCRYAWGKADDDELRTNSEAIARAHNLVTNLFNVGARGKRRGFSPGAAARHSQHAKVHGRVAAEVFPLRRPTSPRAHWIGHAH